MARRCAFVTGCIGVGVGMRAGFGVDVVTATAAAACELTSVMLVFESVMSVVAERVCSVIETSEQCERRCYQSFRSHVRCCPIELGRLNHEQATVQLNRATDEHDGHRLLICVSIAKLTVDRRVFSAIIPMHKSGERTVCRTLRSMLEARMDRRSRIAEFDRFDGRE